jgi:hypothetical protein
LEISLRNSPLKTYTMKKIILLCCILLIGSAGFSQEVYSSKNISIKFFSSAPLEDIDAVTQNGTSVLAIGKNEFQFLVQIKSFTFQKSLMQEHFNENYMESDKYPDARFSGRINESIDWKKDGVYNVTVSGKLTVHGTDRDRTIPGTITIKNGNISINSQFDLICKDHGIKIPTMMTEKIAETVKVTVSGAYTPYVKPEKK